MKKYLLPSFLVLLGGAGYWGWKLTHPSPEQLVAEIQKLWIHSQKVGESDGDTLMADTDKMQPLSDRLVSYGAVGDKAAEHGALDPDQGRREASIFLLGIMKDKAAIPLSQYATSGTRDDRFAALTALQNSFPPPYGQDAFLTVIKQPESTITGGHRWPRPVS